MTTSLHIGVGVCPSHTNESLQQLVDEAAAAGREVVELPAGTFQMFNALKLRSNLRVVGHPQGTILLKVPSVSSKVLDFVGYGHYEFRPADPELFRVGMGVYLYDKNAGGFYTTVATIVDRQGDLFFIDRMFNHDYLPFAGGTVETLHAMVEGEDVTDASIERVIIDGNVEETRRLNGCRGGGVFLIKCHRVQVDGVEIRHYNGDACSFQQCTDIVVQNCKLHHNRGGGLHPGSGSVRYLLLNNHIHDNLGDGIFYCLRTTHSVCRDNLLERNGQVGISIGERDTDHLIENNRIVGNARAGVDFRTPIARSADRVQLVHNTIGPNCTDTWHFNFAGPKSAEITIAAGLEDLHIASNTIQTQPQGVALEVAAGSRRISFVDNQVNGRVQQRADIAGEGESVALTPPASLFPVGPAALPVDAVKHLNLAPLQPWAR